MSTPTASSVELDLVPLTGVLGAEVRGLDLSTGLSNAEVDAVRRAFGEHKVLVFRGQSLTVEDQIEFGRCFGELDTHPFVEPNPDHPEVVEIVTEPDDFANFGGGWHTDVTFLEEPDLGSILYAVELPPVGGDTLFADQAAAYDALSETMKQMLEGLTAIHSAERQYGRGGYSTLSKAMVGTDTDPSTFRVEHPVVRTHPETGRRSLYVNGAFTTRICGMHGDESDVLLRFLFLHAVKAQFTCRVKWEPGTVVMWDNRSVQHHAVHDYAGHRRHMRRLTVKGDRPR